MKKELKDTIIVELGNLLKEYAHFYLVNTEGLNAEKTSALRRKCFKQEVKMVVVKKKNHSFENEVWKKSFHIHFHMM